MRTHQDACQDEDTPGCMSRRGLTGMHAKMRTHQDACQDEDTPGCMSSGHMRMHEDTQGHKRMHEDAKGHTRMHAKTSP